MGPHLEAALTVLPLLVILTAAVLVGLCVARSLRDDAVLDALRAEVRTVGEVHGAVREVRAARSHRSAAR